jgi:GT2 family glycosyltransferase
MHAADGTVRDRIPRRSMQMTNDHEASQSRPAVSVLLPFLGDEREAARALDALCSIERGPDDEVIVADNSPDQVMCAIAPRWPGVRAVPAAEERSAYYARNVAAVSARNGWLLFTDADCLPEPNILGLYFAEPVADDVGAIAGEVFGDRSQTQVIARYQRDRGYLNQERYVLSDRPYAVTANLLVRAEAWDSVGGFLEGVRCDADADFTWRLQVAGWRLGYRAAASVTHSYRETVSEFSRMILGYAAGRAWLNRRYPGAYADRTSPAALPQALVGALRWCLAGDRERARFRAIDALVIVLDRVGLALGNSAPSAPRARARGVVIATTFPARAEISISQRLSELGPLESPLRVEAAHRPERQDLAAARAHAVDYWEDDTEVSRVRALAWLATRHPLRCAADYGRGRRDQHDSTAVPLRVLAPAAGRLLRGHQPRIVALETGAEFTAMRLARVTGLALSSGAGSRGGPERRVRDGALDGPVLGEGGSDEQANPLAEGLG